jgi:hypothetical protein
VVRLIELHDSANNVSKKPQKIDTSSAHVDGLNICRERVEKIGFFKHEVGEVIEWNMMLKWRTLPR